MGTHRPEGDSHEALRPLLFSIAYRVLGSVTDAEDLVQEAFLRLESAGREALELANPKASTVVTRLCIDHLRSARVQREAYVGEWLPEPLLTEVADPADSADSLSQAFLVLLESLSPVERAVFLLLDVLGRDVIADRFFAAHRLGLRMRRHQVNGHPGAAFYDEEDRLVNVVALDIAADSVNAIRSIVNPDKLAHAGPVADLKAILRCGTVQRR